MKSKVQNSLSKTVKNYLASLTDVSESTKAAYGSDLATFSNYFAKKSLESITSIDIENYIDELKSRATGQPLAAMSKQRALSNIKQFFKWAALHSLIPYDPSKLASPDLKDNSTVLIPDALEPAQVARIIKKTEFLRDQALFILLYTSALVIELEGAFKFLKIGDALEIEIQNIDLDKNIINLDDAKYILISKALKPTLKKYLDELKRNKIRHGYLFPSPYSPGLAMGYSNARRSFSKACQEAKVAYPDGTIPGLGALVDSFSFYYFNAGRDTSLAMSSLNMILLNSAIQSNANKKLLAHSEDVRRLVKESFSFYDANFKFI